MTKGISGGRPVSPAFDFDEWERLARTDPDAFEERRRLAIEELISRASEDRRQRLRGLQFRVDMERQRAPTPMAACLRLYTMMWDSVIGPDGLQERREVLLQVTRGTADAAVRVRSTRVRALADVIELSRNRT